MNSQRCVVELVFLVVSEKLKLAEVELDGLEIEQSPDLSVVGVMLSAVHVEGQVRAKAETEAKPSAAVTTARAMIDFFMSISVLFGSKSAIRRCLRCNP